MRHSFQVKKTGVNDDTCATNFNRVAAQKI